MDVSYDYIQQKPFIFFLIITSSSSRRKNIENSLRTFCSIRYSASSSVGRSSLSASIHPPLTFSLFHMKWTASKKIKQNKKKEKKRTQQKTFTTFVNAYLLIIMLFIGSRIITFLAEMAVPPLLFCWKPRRKEPRSKYKCLKKGPFNYPLSVTKRVRSLTPPSSRISSSSLNLGRGAKMEEEEKATTAFITKFFSSYMMRFPVSWKLEIYSHKHKNNTQCKPLLFPWTKPEKSCITPFVKWDLFLDFKFNGVYHYHARLSTRRPQHLNSFVIVFDDWLEQWFLLFLVKVTFWAFFSLRRIYHHSQIKGDTTLRACPAPTVGLRKNYF